MFSETLSWEVYLETLASRLIVNVVNVWEMLIEIMKF